MLKGILEQRVSQQKNFWSSFEKGTKRGSSVEIDSEIADPSREGDSEFRLESLNVFPQLGVPGQDFFRRVL